MKQITKKQLKIGGITLGTIVVGIGLIILIKKLAKPSNKQRINRENKKLKDTNVNVGSEGYVNVRSSPTIDTKNWLRLDNTTNLLKKVTASPVGKIEKRIKGKDGYYWYQLELATPINGKATGYVREDAVEIETGNA
jgi:hypothetical protein